MRTQDKMTKRKAVVISTLLSDPKISQVLFDCWNAPTGSSRNEKARAILSTVKRDQQIQDGQGGGVAPSLPYSIGSDGKVTLKSSSSSSNYGAPIVVKSIDDILSSKLSVGIDSNGKISNKQEETPFKLTIDKGSETSNTSTATVSSQGNTIIAPNGAVLTPWSSTRAGSTQIAGIGTNSTKDKKKDAPVTVSAAVNPNYKAPAVNESTSVEGGITEAINDNVDISDRYFSVDGINVYDRATMKRVTKQEADAYNIWDKIKYISKEGLSNLKDWSAEEAEIWENQQLANEGYKFALVNGGEYLDKASTIKMLEIRYGVSPDTELTEREINGNPSTNSEFGLAYIMSLTPEERRKSWEGLNDSQKSLWKASYDMAEASEYTESAYDAGWGATRFATTVMSDKKLLAKFLGLSEEQAAALPEGLVSEQLNELKDGINKENRIEEQLNEITMLKNRGTNIEERLSDYIKGKDEYLGEIEALIFKSKKAIHKMDTSDPEVAKRMENYMNYLTVLQGRQNKRYIDFLDMGIKEHEAELEQATNLYELSINKAKDEYDRQAPVTQEAFTNFQNMLKESYEGIKIRRDTIREDATYQLQMRQAGLNIASTVLENQKTAYEIEHLNDTKVEPTTSADFNMYKSWYSKEDKDGNTSLTVTDPTTLRDTAATQKHDGDRVVSAFMNDVEGIVSSELSYSGSSSSLSKLKTSFLTMGSKYGDYLDAKEKSTQKFSADEEAYYESIGRDVYLLGAKIKNSVESGMRSYLSNKSAEVKEAFDYIRKGKKENDFVKRYSDTFGSEANAKLLYSSTINNASGYQSIKAYFDTSGFAGNDPVDSAAQLISLEYARSLGL